MTAMMVQNVDVNREILRNGAATGFSGALADVTLVVTTHSCI